MAGLTEYPGGFANGVSVRGMPLLALNPGEVFWVNNTSVLVKGGIGGSNGNKGTYKRPFASIDYAIGRCTASRGDIIVVMPGHVETVTTASTNEFDVIGVTIVGLGRGTMQPQFHFTTNAATDINITAADITFYNMRFTAGVQDITPGAIDIGANGVAFQDCLFDEDGGAENYIIVADIADGMDGLYMDNCEYRGQDADNDHLLVFAGTHDNVVITNNRFNQITARSATVPLIEFATLANNLLVENNRFYMEDAAVEPGCLQLAGTANTGWAANNYVSTVDTGATAANMISAFDVTGLGAFGQLGVTTADLGGAAFNTAETYS